MIARALLAALLCGCLAGLVLGVIQHVRLTPMIMQAETYEAPAGHVHGAQPSPEADAPAAATTGHAGHDHGSAWQPGDGMERTFYTVLASMVMGAGFAALLAGAAFISGLPITTANGWVWGLCGFMAFALAPAAGLPPELPGMPAADVTARQLWWVFTVAATAGGLWLIATRRHVWSLAVAIALLALPHLVGAPLAGDEGSTVPAGLAAAFTANSLAANAVLWLTIGLLLGRFLPHPHEDAAT